MAGIEVALGFSASKRDLDNPKVLSYPSKSAAMFVADSLIFRSDSNGEDLEGYAGAGLYDSITMDPCVVRRNPPHVRAEIPACRHRQRDAREVAIATECLTRLAFVAVLGRPRGLTTLGTGSSTTKNFVATSCHRSARWASKFAASCRRVTLSPRNGQV